jgi:succinyl-diaminopimelate desuccinylase
MVFAGHTDVVPTGPMEAWHSDPFQPTAKGDLLIGRGAADMKSGLAAMIIAAENFVAAHPNHKGSVAFLITSDEEGPSVDGTAKVMAELNKRNEKITYCIVGEASSEHKLGDQVRVGRRGSFHGKVHVKGVQGHIAYPQKHNPIHMAFAALDELAKEEWDQGNEFFPPTSFQFSNIHSGTGALNVVPGELTADFNFRFSTAISEDEMQQRVTAILQRHGLDFSVEWKLSASPFLTTHGKLIAATQETIREITGLETSLSTAGGTSDGRFIAPTGAELVEIGPLNTTAHKVNEEVKISDLEPLAAIYGGILKKLLL